MKRNKDLLTEENITETAKQIKNELIKRDEEAPRILELQVVIERVLNYLVEPVKFEISDDLRKVLEVASRKYKWLAEDRNRNVYLYIEKPIKSDNHWIGRNGFCVNPLIGYSDFNFLSWKDDEPKLIAEVLGL